jgi:hypothetical protein
MTQIYDPAQGSTQSPEGLRQKVQADIDAQAREMCIIICNECAKVCSATLNYCLRMDEQHVEPMHIKTLIACAEICSLNAIWMSRDFDLHTKLCQACADICEYCADSCERISGDRVMSECADICQRCAQSCLRMLVH